MANWIEPIFDRTQVDVDFAIAQISEWKKNGFTTTTELKGCLNTTDMNRIENNIQFLSDRLTSLYYFSVVNTKTWNRSMLPTVTEVERILKNLLTLIASYQKGGNTAAVPTTMVSFEQINSIEENLFAIKGMVDGMVESYRRCGTFQCGEEW